MKMYSNSISIVHSNFRRKEPLYLFIQALFVSGTDTGFRDLLFSLLFPSKKYLKHHDEYVYVQSGSRLPGKGRITNAFPSSSHWLEGPLFPPPEVWHREEEVRVGGVEVNLHTSDWPGQQAQAIRPHHGAWDIFCWK